MNFNMALETYSFLTDQSGVDFRVDKLVKGCW